MTPFDPVSNICLMSPSNNNNKFSFYVTYTLKKTTPFFGTRFSLMIFDYSFLFKLYRMFIACTHLSFYIVWHTSYFFIILHASLCFAAIKLSQVDKYRLRLRERDRRKQIAREYDLITAATSGGRTPKSDKSKKKSKDERYLTSVSLWISV